MQDQNKRLFIPQGINTQQLLGPKTAKFADKYNHLLHYLITARAFDKRLTPESYIPVHSKVHEKYATTRHTANIIKFWLDQAVIEKEPTAPGRKGYVVGEKSISYRLAPEYAQRPLQDVGYIDEKYEKKVTRLTAEFQEGKMDMTVPANSFISFNLKELRINVVAANQHLHKLAATGKYSLEKANVATVRAQAIRDQNWFCKRDVKGHRIHHNWCTLNKSLRKFCYIETGETLVNIDVRNSQPVILCLLLKRDMGTHLTPDVLHYIQLCEQGLFYEFLAKKFGIDIDNDEARTAFKKRLFKTIFYGHNEAARKYAEWDCFQAEFPTVAQFITEYKRYDYTSLSIMLQRIESEIMLEGVVAKIAREHNPEDFFALTIHDSITTTEDRKDYVLELMTQEFRLRGISPTFDTQLIN